MYGLAQAGLLANKILAKRLANHGVAQTQHTRGMWKHHSRTIHFKLVVDGFGVNYYEKQDSQYLINVLREHYESVSVHWTGKLFCGIKHA